jgi:hypothetical protein
MMKTTKAKTLSKPKKTSGAAKTTSKKRPAPAKYIPTDDEIREKAREIYHERLSRGEHGTPESDWHAAEELLRG